MEILTLKFHYASNMDDWQALGELADIDGIAMWLDAETTNNGMICAGSIKATVDVPETLWYGGLELKYDEWQDDGYEYDGSADDFAKAHAAETEKSKRFLKAWRNLTDILNDGNV